MHPCWPLFDLRLRLGDLVLRPVAEADLPQLASVMPDDVELDPRFPTYKVSDPRIARAITLYQTYWDSVGSWRVDSWNVGFVAHDAGCVVGVQGLAGPDFLQQRAVETYSWVVTHCRGRGYAKAMRLAVLAFAFDHLGAQSAHSEAWPDNAASLKVSRSLSYVDGRVGRQARDGRPADKLRMQLTREMWHQRHRDHGVRIEKLDGCRRLFGLD